MIFPGSCHARHRASPANRPWPRPVMWRASRPCRVRVEEVPGSGRRCLVRSGLQGAHARRCSLHEYGERIKRVAVADASSPPGTKGRGQRMMSARSGDGGQLWRIAMLCCPGGPLLPGEVPDGAEGSLGAETLTLELSFGTA